ncbi:hypothetical protein IQ268_19130 [Oculatella sp. LEGE 06141]|uniref:hypothetical protein n=1 Tax=Oculatella sp. LEGE 06141 TaxID=1828648 RepID=UPI00187E4BAC|nr:hypothetical protein [Oculatella sp. LEGE 06141]MBE9180676.1 hypothetical protein [Oculatella sp. LEGE 06141]
MTLFRWMLPLLSSAVLLGCSTVSDRSPTAEIVPSPQVVSSPNSERDTLLTATEADALMADVINAINTEDVLYLMPYMLERDRYQANVEAAIADYQTYFAGAPIERVQRERVEQLGASSQRFEYRLYGSNGISKPITLYQDQSIRLVDEFFLYSHWAKAMLDEVIASIQASDAEQLARALTADDLPYPVDQAETAIDRYGAQFDVDTLDYRFAGSAENRNGFNYVIIGSQNGQPREHPVTVIYGDGLVGLQDNLIPALPSAN